MSDNLNIDTLFEDDPELAALLKSIEKQKDELPLEAPSISPKLSDEDSLLQLDEILQNFQAEPQAIQNQPDTYTLSPTSKKDAKQAPPNTPAKKTLRIVSDVIFLVVCIALVGGSILFASSKDPRKNYLGFRTYNVMTKSMTPREDGSSPPGGFDQGDTIIIKICDPEDIELGDIITFNPTPNDPESTTFLTHRVVEVMDELSGKEGIFFVTRGDANNSNDPPISGAALIGKKIATIPKVGGFLQFMRENFIQSVIIIISLFFALLMFKWYLSDSKKKKKPAVK